MKPSVLVLCAALMASWLPQTGHAQETTPALRTPEAPQPSHLVVIRISEQLFEPIVANAVNVSKPVDDVILGVRVRGHSRTSGRVKVDIAPNHNDASLLFTFAGATTARTVGRSGPAIVHSRADTNFECSSRVTFDLEHGFRAGPTKIRSNTVTTPVAIDTVKRGVRGRLVKRIAWKRVEESRAQASAVSGQHARRDIVKGFEEKLAKQLEELNERVATTELVTALLGGITDTDYSVSSTDKYIEISIRRRNTPEVPARIPEHHVADAAIQVWVHSSVMEPGMFDALRSAAVISDLVRPMLTTIAATWRATGQDMRVATRISNWRVWDRPVFQREFFEEMAARQFALRLSRTLIGLDIASDWLVFGINDVAVVDRRARDTRNTEPVSNRR